ncbi:hypothetical protein WJX73_005693 [Symbiochloris irregularis]|uniref:HMG domain-containing protein n=1 Tax=Symbiochloris irregularis TaxID=706552 RepID=A0AAW1PN87_9CHLO
MALQQFVGGLPSSPADVTLTAQFDITPRLHATAVRAGRTFNDWAVLLKHLRNKFNKFFDFQKGERKLTCLSRERLPRQPQLDAVVYQRYMERVQGTAPFPAVCHVTGEDHTQCSCCQAINWGQEEHGLPCQVVLRGAVVSTCFTSRRCQGLAEDGSPCSGQLTVDGREFGVLRATESLAFGHDLLYHWSDRMVAGHSDTWHTSWLLTILGDKSLTRNQQDQLWGRKGAWSTATLDFIQLQGIDWLAGFRCTCWKKGVSLDGTAVAFHKAQSRIEHPWRALIQEGAERVLGALFSERVFVRDHELRKLLLPFTRKGKGLTVDEHAGLLVRLEALGLEERERALLPFVTETTAAADSGKRIALPGNAVMLACLVGTAPASVYMRPAIFGRVQALLQDGVVAWTGSVSQEIALACPLLHSFLKPHLGAAALPPNVHRLLGHVLQVAQEACRPSTLPPGTQLPAISMAEERRMRASAAAPGDENRPPEQWCILFHVMGDVESPRTVFDIMYTHFPEAPDRIASDNGCNMHSFKLNREPERYRLTQITIDELHYVGHDNCCPAYNTGEYKEITNSSLPEQKNRWIARLSNQVSYMKQFTFMYYMRYYILCLNELQASTAQGTCFFRSPEDAS